jgi:hypothetical protein
MYFNRINIPCEGSRAVTTGNVLTVLFSLPIREGETVVGEATVIAKQVGVKKGLYWKAAGMCCHPPGQSVEVVFQKLIAEEKGDASWRCQFALNVAENSVEIKVAGGTGQRVRWVCYMMIWQLGKGDV